jgi:hypothetical protein
MSLAFRGQQRWFVLGCQVSLHFNEDNLIAPKCWGKSAEEPLLIKIALVIVEFLGCPTADVVII